MLHDAVASRGISVHQLIIPGAIAGGDPVYESAALADRLWDLHREPEPFRVTAREETA
jgi:hypothetical protein